MDDSLDSKVRLPFQWSHRKAHLLLCASCGPALRLVGSRELQVAIEVGELHSDGQSTADQIQIEVERARAAVTRLTSDEVLRTLADIVCRAATFLVPSWLDGRLVQGEPRDVPNLLTSILGLAELVGGVADGRTLFDTLFDDIEARGVLCCPEWRTETVLALAREMYESRDFSAMPILADALQDAGCNNEDVLNHCRGPGPHVRGCWVVDLLLGKE
ncbi:hypothetical protein R5W23_000146 [Gemmata sp. JC673]|uniref:SMI1/KNR4 family protein n=1 Tax=Gemmata algarum TaxID=2975278 RepID=A0ABU5EQT0_9BACT|nr:hypothetical protein [Gemmata algarum]MDY3557619.1 hypothetical protein [Gemmata algarum]